MLLEGCAEISFQYGYMKIVIVSYKQLQNMQLALRSELPPGMLHSVGSAYTSVL
jgi:hypothetical protein